jgi:hypothetical protein
MSAVLTSDRRRRRSSHQPGKAVNDVGGGLFAAEQAGSELTGGAAGIPAVGGAIPRERKGNAPEPLPQKILRQSKSLGAAVPTRLMQVRTGGSEVKGAPS